ncbi:MAG TPA: site-specific integrase [Conexibacter sp.]|nr:site-specific integrase [Conexibacter sp.]
MNGRQHKKLIGPVWTERGRPPQGFYTRKMAEAVLHAWMTDARRGAHDDPITGRTMTFEAACEAWLSYVEHDKGRASTTVGDYRRTCKNHFWPEFGPDTPVRSITKRDVERLRGRLLEEGRMTRASIHKVLVLLHGCMKYAKRQGWITSNPCEDVERVTVKKSGDFQILSVEEVHAVIRAAETEQDAAIFAVAAFAGLRMGELRALRWRDVDFANHTLHIRANYTHSQERVPKSGKVRAVPLIDLAAARLDTISRRELFTQPGDLVFCNPLGSYVHEGDLRRRFYAALRVAGLGHKRHETKPIVFHDLRHTFGTLAVKAWDLATVQGYMGHSDIATTMLYVHHVPKTEHADQLGRLVGRQECPRSATQPLDRYAVSG